MAFEKLYLFVLSFISTVLESSACYYSYTYRENYCYYYSYYSYYYDYWSTPRIIGSAVGGAISLIVCIVVLIVLCRICRARRPAFRGQTFANGTNGPTVTTVSNQQQAGGYNMQYYPQTGVQTTYPQYNYGQPVAGVQQPMAGYSNLSYNPPAYDSVLANETKAQPSAPQ